MIDLAHHAKLIGAQIRFVARHAVSGVRADDEATIAAMKEIVATLRYSADAIDLERMCREDAARERAARNAVRLGRKPEGER